MAKKPAEKKSTSTAVEKVKEQTKAVGAPLDFSADAGQGLEGSDKSSFAIPFLVMLQANSPQVKDIKEAKAGMILNTITGELYDKVNVVPCGFARRYVRWAPRQKGGGYKGDVNPIDVETGKVPGMSQHNGMLLMDVPQGVVNPFDKDGKPEYDHLADTRNHFVLVQASTGAWSPALIAMASTQIKKSKAWMSRIKGIELVNPRTGKPYNPPSFSHIYTLGAAEEKNAKGSWYGFTIDVNKPIDDANLYAAAKTFHDQVVEGRVETAAPVPEHDAADATDTSGKF